MEVPAHGVQALRAIGIDDSVLLISYIHHLIAGINRTFTVPPTLLSANASSIIIASITRPRYENNFRVHPDTPPRTTRKDGLPDVHSHGPRLVLE